MIGIFEMRTDQDRIEDFAAGAMLGLASGGMVWAAVVIVRFYF